MPEPRRKQPLKSAARRSRKLDGGLQRLGKRLRALRKSQGLTQEALAARARIDAKHYQQLEYGDSNATFATLAALARALGITLSELFKGV